ncbi:hypothetical protein PAAG_11797 [Paracoccidioides lutzii Pb01]|uniref:Uncharacterized protein n=1 Tax=Paracoccidioides lutzii (strain ATCC MYA-826 / Pb01) TaxID=502779 RepID=A0A0A2VKM7_PARBA|nr:hypothetical protein PAAG_11797 [Paracoccidioides lutzii Pb01]KGQ01449.1 hypothetical protein PAAG_11797 [Paracoccidioides lutzii Pb01]
MERLPSANFTYRPFASPDPPVPSVMKRFLENFHAGIHSSTDLYICCICGDGPKVFQNQGRSAIIESSTYLQLCFAFSAMCYDFDDLAIEHAIFILDMDGDFCFRFLSYLLIGH